MSFLSIVKQYIDKAMRRGFSYIVISSILNKIFVFASTVFLNRILSQQDYGYISFAYNIVSIILVVSSLGVDVSLLQFCCEDRPEYEKRSLEKYAFIIGITSNLVFSAITLIIARLWRFNIPDSMEVLAKFSFLLPFPFVVKYCSALLRSKLDNKKFALLTNISSAAYLGGLIIFAVPFGLNGAIIGRYFGFVVPAALGILLCMPFFQSILSGDFPKKTLVNEFMSYGITVMLTNGVSSLLYYIDIYVVGIVTSNAISIAAYKTATIIPNALATLPNVIVVFIYPYFARNKDNKVWIINNTKMIQKSVFAGCICVALVLFFAAPKVIVVFFGEQYLASVLPFRILLLSFSISAPFRVISGNIIAMLGKVKANFVIGLISCLVNIVMDYFFIKLWGSVGAAIATTSIMAIASIMSNIYLYKVFALK